MGHSRRKASLPGTYQWVETNPTENTSMEDMDVQLLGKSSRRASMTSLDSDTSRDNRKRVSPTLSRAQELVSALMNRTTAALTARIRASRYHGWRMGVLGGCVMSSFVLSCNVAILIAGSQIRGGYKQGIADLVLGSASEITRWSTAAHLIINVFSTMLLGASNYAMQVLSSPTRDDVDKVHIKGTWLDIGVLSMRNLRTIPRKRAMLWVILAFSSIPLHLFYNAAIFQLTTHNEYNMSFMKADSDEYATIAARTRIENQTEFQNFSSRAWKPVYSAKYISDYGDLYLGLHAFTFDNVQNGTILNHSVVHTGGQAFINPLTNISWSRDGDWIDYGELTNSSIPNYPYAAHVEKAIATNVESKSSLQLSRDFMLVVIAFNLLKLGVLVWILFHDRSAYIVTLGDAVASFLVRNDPTTGNACLLDKADFVHRNNFGSHHPQNSRRIQSLRSQTEGSTWSPILFERFTLLTKDKQIFLAVVFSATLSAIALVPIFSHSDWRWSTSSGMIVNAGAGALTNAWVVNTPQLALSLCYLALNNICTSLAGAEEWNNMARARKTLRVTDPQGEQRSTYFLQLPYRWSIPLMLLSSILHWLLSQSFFLVRVKLLDRYQRDAGFVSACGFSSLSLIIFWVVASVLVCAIVIICMKKMKQRIPVAASCSLVISAACHVFDNNVEHHLQKLRWGAVEVHGGQLGHCCITSTPGTKKPIRGTRYV